jgi:IS30 family transposase
MVELKKQNYSSNKKLYEKVLKTLREKLSIEIPIEQVGSTAIKICMERIL